MKKGTRLSKGQKIKKAMLVCEMYTSGEYTILQCCQKNGIKSQTTFLRWCEEIEEIEEAYTRARKAANKVYNLNVGQKAKTELEKRLEGYTVKTSETTYEITEDGQKKIRLVKEKEHRVSALDSTVMQVIQNRFPENWKDAKSISLEGSDGQSILEGIKMVKTPKSENNMPPITKKEEAEPQAAKIFKD